MLLFLSCLISTRLLHFRRDKHKGLSPAINSGSPTQPTQTIITVVKAIDYFFLSLISIPSFAPLMRDT